jgi:cysteinyl-tRNA synthetase
MPIRIYSTLSRKKEILKPIKGKDIKFFVCGITPYDSPHIGHSKTYVQFDFIVKYLRFKKYNVFYLQNITDIDDRIIEKSKLEKKNWREIPDKYVKIFLQNMEDLHIDSVSKYAPATDYIKDIISQVKTLIKKGYAYKIEDGYYFDLSKFPDYGKLSGRTTTDAESAITRIDDSLSKKNKGDFCLWKFSKENEPSWPADIGSGRPGWHIEDTAITEHFFGPQYDMHGGARDLIFPHHEAEIAQMESASGKKPLVKYWIHTGFLNISGTKMSKSLGNFITISDLLKKYDYRLLRFFYITKQYRTPIDFSYDLIDQSKTALDRLNEFVNNSKGKKSKLKKALLSNAKKDFYAALDDDFDTPKAFSVLFDFVREANKQGPNDDCYKFMKEINSFLDIFNFDEQEIPKEIVELAKKRLEARKNKDFKLSDELRSQAIDKGYIIEDSDNGFKVKKKE